MRNEHASELGNPVPKGSPIIFLKPSTSLLLEPNPIELPVGSVVHHEIELGVVIGKAGRDIPQNKAKSFISGYVLALDMTDRTHQDIAKKGGLPWTVGKGFDTFSPISRFIHKDAVQDPHNLNLWLKVNGKTVQEGNTKDMIFNIPSLIEYVSSIMKLEEGDLILTGTPKGVGPVVQGNLLTAGIGDGKNSEDILTMSFPVVQRKGLGLFAAKI